jgi:hypothetical protein
MHESLEIRVHLRNSDIPVRVSTNDPIGVLSASLRDCDPSRHIFLIGREVLLPAFTFAFSRVRDGTRSPSSRAPSALCRPDAQPRFHQLPSPVRVRERSAELIQLFGYRTDGEAIQRALEEFADPAISSEAARTRNQHFSQMEGNSSSHRRLIARFTSLNERSQVARIQVSHYEALSPTSASSEALPCFWVRRKKGSASANLVCPTNDG